MFDLLVTNIQRLASELGMNTNTALLQSGVGKNFISNIRQGSAPSTEKVVQLADYFNVSTDYLLGRTDDREKEPAPEDEGGLDPELAALIKRIPADRMPEVERYLRFQAEQEEKP